MTGQEVLHTLGNSEFKIHHPAVAKDHDKKTQPSPAGSYLDGAIRSPVHLGTFAGSKGQGQKSPVSSGPDPAYVFREDGIPACVALFPDAAQHLNGCVGMSLQHPDDGVLAHYGYGVGPSQPVDSKQEMLQL